MIRCQSQLLILIYFYRSNHLYKHSNAIRIVKISLMQCKYQRHYNDLNINIISGGRGFRPAAIAEVHDIAIGTYAYSETTKINILVHYRRLRGSKSENNKHLCAAVWPETNRLYYTHILYTRAQRNECLTSSSRRDYAQAVSKITILLLLY